MKTISKLLFILAIIVTNTMANNNTVNKVKRLSIPLYETKSFNDFSKRLDHPTWKSVNKNVVKLSGIFYPNKRKKVYKAELDYTITLNNDDSLKTIVILSKLTENGEFVKILKAEYKADKWLMVKWQSYAEYKNDPNRKRYKRNPEKALLNLYKSVFQER